MGCSRCRLGPVLGPVGAGAGTSWAAEGGRRLLRGWGCDKVGSNRAGQGWGRLGAVGQGWGRLGGLRSQGAVGPGKDGEGWGATELGLGRAGAGSPLQGCSMQQEEAEGRQGRGGSVQPPLSRALTPPPQQALGLHGRARCPQAVGSPG